MLLVQKNLNSNYDEVAGTMLMTILCIFQFIRIILIFVKQHHTDVHSLIINV